MDVPAEKPRFRGRLHQAAFFVALPAGVVLVLLAHSATARVGGLVYAVTLAGLFGSSAAYHRGQWSERARRWMKRLDHASIYLLIAGTYTPFCLLVLHGRLSIAILVVVWIGALAGIGLKMWRIDGLHVISGILYVALGWLVVVAGPQIVSNMSPLGVALVIAGGAFYTAGAIVLASKRPNPNPAVFGYHEVWHAATIAASACHYAAILLVLRAAG